MFRWISFFIAILVGLGIGLFFGWVAYPVEYVDTAPNSLRQDYKTDYVLMVAEAYQVEDNLALAVRRLALLGGEVPEAIVQQAALEAARLGYEDRDLELMQDLRRDLLSWNPSLEVTEDAE
ncbi:MAG: hypothetical protein R3335_03955 [Anaerolineales bacterium]|nr:hypothetical protein [Anaerolineales bacterium]